MTLTPSDRSHFGEQISYITCLVWIYALKYIAGINSLLKLKFQAEENDDVSTRHR